MGTHSQSSLFLLRLFALKRKSRAKAAEDRRTPKRCAHECPREALWSAPVLWRFDMGAPYKQMPRPYYAKRRATSACISCHSRSSEARTSPLMAASCSRENCWPGAGS